MIFGASFKVVSIAKSLLVLLAVGFGWFNQTMMAKRPATEAAELAIFFIKKFSSFFTFWKTGVVLKVKVEKYLPSTLFDG